MKKAVSLFLSLLILLSVVVVPMSVSAASHYRPDDVDFYVADCLTFGITDPLSGTNNGNSQVSLAVNHNYVYKAISEAIIEDGGLVFNSLYWQNLRKTIDGKFLEITEWKKALYVTLLLDYLNYYTNSAEYESNLAKNSVKFANQIYTDLLDYANDTYYKDVDELINNVSLSDAVEFSDKYGYVTKLKDYNTLAEDITKVGTKALDYYKGLSKALAVQQANEDTVNFLKKMKEHASDNADFCAAVDSVCYWYRASYDSVAFSESIPVMFGYLFESVFEFAAKEFPPLETVFKELKVYTAGLNWLFNNDDISENNLKMVLLYIVRSYAVAAIYDAKQQYASYMSLKNAVELNDSFYAYLNFEKYASDSAKGFLSSVLFDGLWNSIKNIFSDTNELTYEQFRMKIDADISFCSRMEMLVNQFYDIFISSDTYKDNVISEGLDTANPDGGDVVKEYVQFAVSEMSLFLNGTLTNPAVSYPYQSTNLTYTSGNSSIATVDQSGKITPISPGTVKIYATAYGGAKASCTITVTPFYANEVSGGVEISSYAGSYATVNIPRVIQNRTIVSIGKNAFSWKRNVKEVTLPNSLKTISDYAFYYCYDLQNITLPNSITHIGQSAFGGCSKLVSISLPNGIEELSDNLFYGSRALSSVNIPNSVKRIGSFALSKTNIESVNIPDSVKTIDEYAFNDCPNLKSVYIGSGVTNIIDRAFDRCTAITEIGVNPSNNNYSAENNVLFNKNKNELILFPAGKTDSEYTVPSRVSVVRKEAFANNSHITKVTISNSTSVFETGIFSNCSNLKEVILPSNMSQIPSSMFNYCTDLESITIPESVTSIGSSAFNNCQSLEEIEIPSSVQSIGGSAFWGCSSLKNIIIPNSVTSLGSGAFGYCSSAENLKIGNGVTEIYEETFYGCSNLKNIEFGTGVKAIGYSAFGFINSLERLVLSDSVETITEYAFIGCENLKTVYLGKGLKDIGEEAFSMCHDDLAYRAHKGTYAFNWIKNNSFKYTVVFDVSGDEIIDANDLSALRKRLITNSNTITEADCNQDGCVDIRDLIRLKKSMI